MSKKTKLGKFFSSLFSLGITFAILWLLSQNIKAYSAGDHSSTIILYISLCALALFILPFIFFPKAVRKKRTHPERSAIVTNEAILELKIRKVMELNTEYSPNIIQKCPKCGFENLSHTKKCFNCGFSLSGF